MQDSLYPYPEGWYVVSFSDELKAGQVKPLKFMGQELVLYRTQSGKAAVLDAYCPHMGAHFAHGGDVDGEAIRCPFHSFKFDTDGVCVATGYGTKAPPRAKARSWPVQEKNGQVLAYHHPEKAAAAEWQVPDIDSEGWTPLQHIGWEMKSHPQETTENSVDIGHLSIVHGYDNVEERADLITEGPFLKVQYAMDRVADFVGLPGKHIRAEFVAQAYGLGYSFVEANIPSLGLTTRHFVFPTPIEGDKIKLSIAMSMKKLKSAREIHPLLFFVPAALLNGIIPFFAFKAYINDVSQDFKIWENKKYIHPPALAKGDGPVGKYRQWVRQFYPNQQPIVSAQSGNKQQLSESFVETE